MKIKPKKKEKKMKTDENSLLILPRVYSTKPSSRKEIYVLNTACSTVIGYFYRT